VVAETYDGFLSDINGMHVKAHHVFKALDSAVTGRVAEGNVGSGTGMICHGFKGGIGTASRMLPDECGGWTVGVLVQANYGQRHRLSIDGVPVGEAVPVADVPAPGLISEGAGSIIVLVATDAPLIPIQCRRLAQRASLGIGRVGGLGENGSGDLMLAFTTAHHGLQPDEVSSPISVSMLAQSGMNPLFEAVVEATEEAIVNALCAATTMTGANNRVVHELPLDALEAVMRRYGRLA
ncbi:MAG: P1 family peptidase, partial [Thermomicrobiales bacterium]